MNIKTILKTNAKKFNSFQKTKKWKNIIISSSLITWLIFFVFSFFFSNFKFNIPNEVYIWQIISASIVGITLPFSGYGMQGVTRNEMSGPTTLGFLPITTTGLILFLFLDKFFPHTFGIYMQYIFSIILSFIILFFIFYITYIKNKSNNTIILLGLMIGILFGSLNGLLIFLFPEFSISSSPFLGQLQIIFDWKRFYISVPINIIGTLMILINCKKINIIQNNSDLANSLGINQKRVFWMTSFASILISVGSIYLIGSIMGIAIVIPNVIKRVCGCNKFLFISCISSIWTSIILIFAVLMNTVYSYGLNLFTIFFIAPLFIWIIIKRKM